MKRQSNWTIFLFLAAFLAILGLAARSFFSQYPVLNSENLDQFIRGFGPWAFLVFALAYLVASPIPFMAPILSATGGLLFGPIVGALLAILVAALTSLVPFMISRHLGREWVEAKMKGTRADDIYHRLDSGNGFTFVLLLRLVPVMPWEVQNYVAGVTRVAIPTYFAATILGSAPLTLCLAILGAAFRRPQSWEFLGAIFLTALVLITPIVVFYVRNRKQSVRDADSNETN
jgi:uncharacterized membrane protein YdjX (TVP38/TMEM64 family)